MGILDNKKRILDVHITDYGRKELSRNKFNISYVGYSDSYAQYVKDEVSGSQDISNNPYFECVSLDRDQITFEADDSGKLSPFGKKGNLSVFGGKILSSSSTQYKSFITGSEAFSSLANDLLSGSIENFQNLRIISTKDIFLDSENFNVSQNNLEFNITDHSPLSLKSVQSIRLDDIESIFQDKRMSHVPNFKFLPPINKKNPRNPNGTSLGKFVPIGQEGSMGKNLFSTGLSYNILLNQLKGKEVETIHFTETSNQNNIICQFFEITKKEMKKLDVIDFGIFGSDDPKHGTSHHVFFVGKIMLDSMSRHTFVNLFTLIFS